MALAGASSLAVLLGGLLIFVELQNAQAVKSERAMVAGGIAAFADSAELIVMDYGWWSEGLSRVEQNDIAWLWENVGTPIATTKIFDLVAYDQVGAVPFGWDQSNLIPNGPAAVLDTSTADRMRSELIEYHAKGTFITSAFVDVSGVPMLLSATLVGDVEDRAQMNPVNSPMLVIGQRLDDGFVEDIATTFLLKDLMIQASVPAGAAAAEINDDRGRLAGFLTWTPSRPGLVTAQAAALPLAVIVIAFGGLMALINVRAGRMALRAMRSELEAKTAARTDRLTDLDNRHGFNEYIESHACQLSARAGELAILFFDLNGFKAINDSAGHTAGDFVLKEVASRFVSALPARGQLSRIGGDEFACLLTGPLSDDDVHRVALSLASRLEAPILFDKAEYKVSAAVGYAVARTDDPVGVDVLIHRADLAMYKAKSEGLSQPLAYCPEFEIERKRRRALMDDLEAGLQNGEIYVEYQPIVSARDGEIVLVEALARWNSPNRGQVAPDDFIAIAEEYGFIHELGAFVLKSACETINMGVELPIAINVSPIQLQDPGLCEKFQKIISDAGVRPEMIEIELTENVLVANPVRAKAQLQQFSEAGFKISLDDYGTGFSSLGYLREFPFDKVKIDRSFVQDCGVDESKLQVLRSLSLLANAYELAIVAEGVETKEQAEFLRLVGYDFLQGFNFGRPMAMDVLEGMLSGQRLARANAA